MSKQNKEIAKHKKELDLVIEKYVKLFEKKHDVYFEFWVLDRTGTIACFSNEYYIDFDDLRLDLEENISKKMFFAWYELALNLGLKNEPIINYRTFIKTK